MNITLTTEANTYRYQNVTKLSVQENPNQPAFTITFHDGSKLPLFLSGVNQVTIQYKTNSTDILKKHNGITP